MKRSSRYQQRGLGLIAVIVVLVILSALAAAVVALSTGQHRAGAMDMQAARALQVAGAGVEWGLHRALLDNSCATTSWTSPDYTDFLVTVVCSANTYNDGESSPGVAQQIRVFNVVATACNSGAAACPLTLPSHNSGYVERSRQAVAYCNWTGAACSGP